MARQAESAALPSTPAQLARYERVIQAGTAILSAGGEDALQTAALTRVRHETSRSYSEVLERLFHRHIEILRVVAESEGPIAESQRRLLPVVAQMFGIASTSWLSGVMSASDARFHIRIGCRLLDLPDEVVREDLDRAQPAHPVSA